MRLLTVFFSYLRALYIAKGLTRENDKVDMLEPPQLGIKTARMETSSWMGKLAAANASSKILALAPPGGTLFVPQDLEAHSWSFVQSDDVDLEFPSNFYDVVYLNNVLGKCSPETRRQIVAASIRVLKPGGQAISVCPACDDAKDLYTLASSLGYNTLEFEAERLKNKEIARLKPSHAVYLKTVVHIPSRKRLVSYFKDMGFSEAKLEHLWRVNNRFSVNRLMVGLVWQKK